MAFLLGAGADAGADAAASAVGDAAASTVADTAASAVADTAGAEAGGSSLLSSLSSGGAQDSLFSGIGSGATDVGGPMGAAGAPSMGHTVQSFLTDYIKNSVMGDANRDSNGGAGMAMNSMNPQGQPTQTQAPTPPATSPGYQQTGVNPYGVNPTPSSFKDFFR